MNLIFKHDARRLVVERRPHDLLVNLDLLEWKTDQIGTVRISASIIVKCKRHSHFSQLMHMPQHPLRGANRRALRHLQRQHGRRNMVTLKHRSDGLSQILAQTLHHRNVHMDRTDSKRAVREHML